jgi:hypothetical protein
MATGKPSNMQGDLFSRGFPKYNESYYFFSISNDPATVTEFTKKLAVLVKNKEISTLEKVLLDWKEVEAHKGTIYPVSHALIAFSMAGLRRVSLPTNTFIMNADLGRFKLACRSRSSSWISSRTPTLHFPTA